MWPRFTSEGSQKHGDQRWLFLSNSSLLSLLSPAPLSTIAYSQMTWLGPGLPKPSKLATTGPTAPVSTFRAAMTTVPLPWFAMATRVPSLLMLKPLGTSPPDAAILLKVRAPVAPLIAKVEIESLRPPFLVRKSWS
jgi:hypothetical protein